MNYVYNFYFQGIDGGSDQQEGNDDNQYAVKIRGLLCNENG